MEVSMAASRMCNGRGTGSVSVARESVSDFTLYGSMGGGTDRWVETEIAFNKEFWDGNGMGCIPGIPDYLMPL